MASKVAAGKGPRVWALLSFGDDRQYAGNRGYSDEVGRIHRYDSFVPNSRQLAAGDLVLISGRNRVHGYARVEEVASEPGEKPTDRCPECSTTGIKRRKHRSPLYRCDKGHEFDRPATEMRPCVLFEARYEASYRPAPAGTTFDSIRPFQIAKSDQSAIRRLSFDRISTSGPAWLQGALAVALKTPVARVIRADDAEEEASAGYEPAGQDERERVTRQIMARRGQKTFRDGLRRRFGETCAVSGSAILQLLEAAHIRPYRGPRDNHPSNGLLLRADIHTLFDLNLIGIHPETLKVHVHPEAARDGYELLAGNSLRGAARPDRKALEQRWALFQRRCRPIASRENRSRG